jgi:acyl carrier protein
MDNFLRLKQWLAGTLDIREEIITPQSTLDDLFWEKQGTPPDSMDIVEFVMAFDKQFGTELAESDIESPSGDTTIQQIVEIIDRETAGH